MIQVIKLSLQTLVILVGGERLSGGGFVAFIVKLINIYKHFKTFLGAL